MPDLNFAVEGAAPVEFAAAPLLALKLRITNTPPEEEIHSIALRCQIQIEPTRRQYTAEEKAGVRDLFGEPAAWGRTLRTMLWTHANVNTGRIAGDASVDLPVPCTFDFNVAAAKYFHGMQNGEVPLRLLFSGTVFYEGEGGALQVTQIPWSKEVQYRLPVSVWKGMMDIYYPNSAWLCLRRDAFERLNDYKMRHGIPTWEQALERLLA